ncbi:site-specific DNA-methyltransferase [Microbacterium sp. MMO-10]|uniref:site-specific DNA-methyltransferase n=1 Tax=Microbacterium sp. MMO-10 TaxID=3081272 RepID=UPI00301B50EC
MTPYYEDDYVTLYHGDSLEVTDWTAADVLVTDPPYGRDWKSGSGMTNAEGRGRGSKAHGGIANDKDTQVRDAALGLWGRKRPAVVFGDPLIQQPGGAVQALAYVKPLDAGIKGAHAGFRRDIEMIYLVGPWPVGVGGSSSALTTGALVAGPRGLATRYGHPHAKPVDVLERLIAMTDGVVGDPFSGSGSTLVAARNLGRRAIGVEVSEEYCEKIAGRLAQQTLFEGVL